MKHQLWVSIHPRFTPEMLGFIPSFLDNDDPRGAREQINERYIGGWSPFPGFKLLKNGDLSYPGDPPTRLLAEGVFGDEHLRFYEHAWLMVMQKDGSWEVSRLD